MKNIFIFLSFLLILSISFLPALQVPYLHHDAVMYWVNPQGTFPHAYHAHNFSLGRFLGAYIQSFLGLLVKTVSDLTLLRFLSVLTFSSCAFLFFLKLQDYFQNRINTFLTTVIIFTLPPFQIIVSYTGISFVPYAVLLSILSFFYASKGPLDIPWQKRLLHKYTVISILLMIGSFSIYQSAAPFYWSMTGVFLLTAHKLSNRDFAKNIAHYFTVGILSMCLYALILKVTKQFLHQFEFGMYNPHQFSFDIIKKMSWFITEPLFNALNLWNVFPNKTYAYIVSAFLFLNTLVYFALYSKNHKDGRSRSAGLKRIFANLTIFLSLILLSFSPNLIAPGEAPFYRCLIGLSTLILISQIWSLNFCVDLLSRKRKNFILTCLLLIAAILGIEKSYTNIFYFRAKPSYAEFEFLKASLQSDDLSHAKYIHVIRPLAENVHHRYDEFGIPTSFWHLNIGPMLRCAFLEINKRSEWTYFRDKISSGNSHFEFTEPVLVIDMNQLYSPGGKLEYLSREE